MPHRSSHFSCCAHSRTLCHPGAPPHRTPHWTTRQGCRLTRTTCTTCCTRSRWVGSHFSHRFEVGSNFVCETVTPRGTLQPTCTGMQGAPITAAEHTAPLIPIQMLTLLSNPCWPSAPCSSISHPRPTRSPRQVGLHDDPAIMLESMNLPGFYLSVALCPLFLSSSPPSGGPPRRPGHHAGEHELPWFLPWVAASDAAANARHSDVAAYLTLTQLSEAVASAGGSTAFNSAQGISSCCVRAWTGARAPSHWSLSPTRVSHVGFWWPFGQTCCLICLLKTAASQAEGSLRSGALPGCPLVPPPS